MSNICNENLPNFGAQTCGLEMAEIKRFLITSYLKEDGSRNYITKSNAAAIANWQTLFNKFNFSSDKLEKVVPTCLIYDAKSEQADAETYDNAGYFEKLRDGDYNISFLVIGKDAGYIKELKKIENNTIAVYAVDNDSRVWGRSEGLGSSTNLYPIKVKNVSVQNFGLKSRENPSMSMVTMRIENPAHMNDLWSVQIADGDVTLDSDFYSLVDATGTISSPATTGCVAVITDDRYNEAVTGLEGTGDYVYWNFYDNAAPTVAIPLTGDGDITESPTGTYTISKVGLLSSGHTYLLKVSHPGYDIDSMTVTVA